MRDMHIGHDPVIVTQPGNPLILDSTAVYSHELADGIAVTDFQPGRLARVFLALPMRVGPLMTVCGPIEVPGPISTSAPIMA